MVHRTWDTSLVHFLPLQVVGIVLVLMSCKLQMILGALLVPRDVLTSV